MKRKVLTISLILIASIQIGCQTTQKNQDAVPEKPNYVFDEQRQNSIHDMCMLTLKMLDDESIPEQKLIAQLSEIADTLELVVQHCSNFYFKIGRAHV